MVAGVVFSAAAQAAPGGLDLRFSGDGKQTTDFGGSDQGGNGVALQADGKIVVVGSAAGSDFALARYNPNGSLDPSFSGDGKQTTDFGGFDQANGVALQATARSSRSAARGADGDFALARYNPNGSLDPSFSGDGRQTTDFGGFDDANGVALQADGKIVAVGRAPDGKDFALARYNPNGSLDPSFSGDGKQTTDFGGCRRGDRGGAPGRRQDRRGRPRRPRLFADDFALARYNPNGSLDPSFSGDGKQTTDFGDFDRRTGWRFRATARSSRSAWPSCRQRLRAGPLQPQRLARHELLRRRQADDRLWAALGATAWRSRATARSCSREAGGFPSDFALARYNPDGSLDTSFSGDGQQTTDFGGDLDAAFGVALQGDGKIVAVGVGRGIDGTSDFALARYLRTGAAAEAGGDFTCGANHNGTLACWGSNAFGKATPPPGTFTAVSAGGDHSLRREDERRPRLLGPKRLRPGQRAPGHLHLGERRLLPHLRAEGERHPRLQGQKRQRPGDAACGHLHRAQRRRLPHLRDKDERRPRLLGRRQRQPTPGHLHGAERRRLPHLRDKDERRRRLLGPKRRRPGQPARGHLHRGGKRRLPHLRDKNKRRPGLLGPRQLRPSDAARGHLHGGERRRRPHLRHEDERHRDLLGRQRQRPIYPARRLRLKTSR